MKGTDAVATDPLETDAAATDTVTAGPQTIRPLDDYRDRLAEAGGPKAKLEIIAPKAILNLRGRADDPGFAEAVRATFGLALPTEPNRCHSADADDQAAAEVISWLGPDEWLVMAEAGTEEAFEASLRTARPDDPWLAITDLSHTYTGLRLSGILARDILASGCPLDLHPRVFGVDHCAQTMLAKARVFLRQISVEPAFEIWVRNSFVRYLADWLVDAAGLAITET
ncbi:MAG: sarcosine oxidase subunit gamma family protein [Pseudomonadota bacterium]